MLAERGKALPIGEGWQYEPKWDGFRCIVFFDGTELLLQSRNGAALNRHFPELVTGFTPLLSVPVVLDGEIVIAGDSGLDFDALLTRMTATGKRATVLAIEKPAAFVAFDVLALGSEDLLQFPLSARRRRLEELLAWPAAALQLSPSTDDIHVAEGSCSEKDERALSS